MKKRFVFSKKLKTISFVLMAIGLISGILAYTADTHRFWANILFSNYYFLILALGAAFWLALQYIAEAGWSAAFKRVPESISCYVMPAFIFMALLVLVGLKYVYPWANPEGHIEDFNKFEEFGEVLHKKSPYLNAGFFITRTFIYFLVWLLTIKILEKFSKKEDEDKANALKWFEKSRFFSKVHIFAFALTFIFAGFDYLMSLEPFWYSTLFSIKELISGFFHASALIILIVYYLHKQGYYPFMNSSHWHDFSKYLFMGSILFAYAWYFQYMLIWYGNIPEEGEYYFLRRFHFSQTLFTLNIIINFFLPFIILLPNKLAKNPKVLLIMSLVILAGLFLDVYLSVFPPLTHTFNGMGEHIHPVFGLYEIGIFLGFLGIFMFIVFNKMAKRKHILPINHPYIEESLMHHNAH